MNLSLVPPADNFKNLYRSSPDDVLCKICMFALQFLRRIFLSVHYIYIIEGKQIWSEGGANMIQWYLNNLGEGPQDELSCQISLL